LEVARQVVVVEQNAVVRDGDKVGHEAPA
jgi:hypothetical protein